MKIIKERYKKQIIIKYSVNYYWRIIQMPQ